MKKKTNFENKRWGRMLAFGLAILTEARVRRAMDLLLYSDFTVAEIAELCGYADQNYFSRIFKKYASMSPSEYRPRNFGRRGD